MKLSKFIPLPFHKTKRTIILVDFQYWYYSSLECCNCRPNIHEWLKGLEQYDTSEIYFFVDFSNPRIVTQMNVLKNIKCQIVNIKDMFQIDRRGNTSVAILDYLYRLAHNAGTIKKIILFSGKNHFYLGVKYLIQSNIPVEVHGFKNAIGPQLAEVASSIIYTDIDITAYYPVIINYLDQLTIKAEKNGSPQYITFQKTVEQISILTDISYIYIEGAMHSLFLKSSALYYDLIVFLFRLLYRIVLESRIYGFEKVLAFFLGVS